MTTLETPESPAAAARGAVLATFAGLLTDATIDRLLGAGEVRTYPFGAEIYADDEPHVGVLLAGIARVYLQSWDGRQLTVRHRRAGAFLGKVPSGGRRIRVRVEADAPCTILELSREAFRQMLAACPDLALAAHLDASAILAATYATLGVNAFGTVRDRLTHTLLELAERDRETAEVTVRATQQQLADDIGSPREVVTRVLAEMSADGLVVTGKGRIEIADPFRLAASIASWTDPQTWAVLG